MYAVDTLEATDLCVLILYPISLLKMFLRCKVFCFVLFCLVWFGCIYKTVSSKIEVRT